MTYGISNANYVFGDENAIRVDHPRGDTTWFYRDEETREHLMFRDGRLFRSTVDRDDIERIANHDDNEHELVAVEDSPFEGAA